MPQQITFDIATRVVDDKQHIWSVFPGLGRRFFTDFFGDRVVFLDTPAISLTTNSLKDDALLRQHVAMSTAWKHYLRTNEGSIPSRNPDHFTTPTDRSFSAALGNVRNLFVKAKKGDIVLTGQYDVYSPILVGEIASDFDPKDTIELSPYGANGLVPVRKINWLNTRYERRFLPQELSRQLSNRKAVTEVDIQDFGQEIFKIAYSDFMYGSISRYVFEGPKYSNSATATIPGIRLLTYFCAAYNASEKNALDDFASLNIDAAITKYYDEDLLSAFEIDFKSPGDYTLIAKRAAMATFVALLVAATGGDCQLNELRAAQLVNSAATTETTVGAPGPCPVPIEEKYRGIMDSINAERFNQICALNSKAKQGVGLKVGVRKRTGSSHEQH